MNDLLADSPRPTRRYYSPQRKAEVIQECRQGSASVAGVALAHGINANIVHRWLHDDERAACCYPPWRFLCQASVRYRWSCPQTPSREDHLHQTH